MPANPIATYLKFGHLQMAAEAFLIDRDTGTQRFRDERLKDALVLGNDHSSKFPPTLAADFIKKYEVVAHQPNTSTGFSGTLFRAIDDDPETGTRVGDLVMSFRSTEFIDDNLRDSAGNNKNITWLGWGFGQIVDMEDWYRSLIDAGQLTAASRLDLTGYSLGGHLATAFAILRREAGADVVKHIYTFNGAGTGDVQSGVSLTQVVERFRAIWQDSLPPGLPPSLLELMRVRARRDLASFLEESRRVHTLVPEPGGPTNKSPEGAYVSENFWLAAHVAAQQTSSALRAGNNPLSPNYANSRFLFDDLMTELRGSGISGVADGGLRHSRDRVSIPIEDQPAVRGTPISAFPDLALSNHWNRNDFGDTHSLVLLIDSLTLMSAFARLDPTLTPATLTRLFSAATWSKGEAGSVNEGQGTAEGDTLETLLDALITLLSGGIEQPRLRQAPGINQGNTWWEVERFREPFHAQLAALTNKEAFKTLLGRATVELLTNQSADVLARLAKGGTADALAYAYALKALNPFALRGADYSAFNRRGELDPYDPVTGKGQLSDEYLLDRAAFLTWKNKLASEDYDASRIGYTKSGTPDAWFKDLSSDLTIRLGRETGLAEARRFFFWADQESGSEILDGGAQPDRLYGGASDPPAPPTAPPNPPQPRHKPPTPQYPHFPHSPHSPHSPRSAPCSSSKPRPTSFSTSAPASRPPKRCRSPTPPPAWRPNCSSSPETARRAATSRTTSPASLPSTKPSSFPGSSPNCSSTRPCGATSCSPRWPSSSSACPPRCSPRSSSTRSSCTRPAAGAQCRGTAAWTEAGAAAQGGEGRMIVAVDCPLHRLCPSSSGTYGLPSTLYLSFDDPSLTTGISSAARSDILSAFVALVAQAKELLSDGLDTLGWTSRACDSPISRLPCAAEGSGIRAALMTRVRVPQPAGIDATTVCVYSRCSRLLDPNPHVCRLCVCSHCRLSPSPARAHRALSHRADAPRHLARTLPRQPAGRLRPCPCRT